MKPGKVPRVMQSLSSLERQWNEVEDYLATLISSFTHVGVLETEKPRNYATIRIPLHCYKLSTVQRIGSATQDFDSIEGN